MKKTLAGSIIVLLGVLTFGAVKMYVIDPKTVSTTDDILELYYQSRDSLPPLPSPVNYQDVMDQLAEGRFDFVANPNWAYIHVEGTYYLSEDSKYSKEWNLPMTLLAYEDLASGKVVLTGVPVETEKLQTLAIVDAPEFSEFDEKASIESYLMSELWPRRIIWSATLKAEADAWNDLAVAESLPSEPMAPLMMSMSLPASPTNLVLAINSTNTNSVVDIEIGYPVTFSNKVEVYATTNLVEGKWEVVSSPIVTTNSSTVVWPDAQANLQFRAYRAGNADLDTDLDEIVDAREVLLYGSDPTSADSDGDGVDDGDELNCGTELTNQTHYCVTLQGTVTNLTEHTEPVYAMAALVNLPAPPNWLYLQYDWMEVADLQQVPVSNGTFIIDHLVVDQRASNEVWNLVVGVYQDVTTNGVLDYFEPMHFVMASVTNHAMNYDFEIVPQYYADKDNDELPDLWEFQNGLSGTNKADAFADPDGDWIDNLWEYRLETDIYTYNTNNYAFADAMRAVDSRIAGKDPAEAIYIYEEPQGHSTGTYVRNTNCWAADIDLTMCSPWNSDMEERGAGTLVSPRHALFVNHQETYVVDAGETLRFVDATNGVYTATIDSIHHLNTTNTDLTVAVLTTDVPTNRFSFAKVLPDNFTDYIGHADIHVPGLGFDQDEKARIHELDEIRLTQQSVVGSECRFNRPISGARANYYEAGLIGGDSGNPAFIVLNGEPVLVTLWVYNANGGFGPSITLFKNDINDIMNQTGYSLSEINLSDYDEIPLSLR